MIRISDFSATTKKLYRECKAGDRAGSDLIEALIEADFSKSDILQFAKRHFKALAGFYQELYELR